MVWGQPKSDLHRDNVWVFAEPQHINGGLHDGIKLNFSGDSLSIRMDTFLSAIDWGNISISDEQGSLILFSNGCSIFNNENKTIQFGHFFNSGYFDSSHCPDGSIITKGMILLPLRDSTFYFIYQRLVYDQIRRTLLHDRVYYSKIEKRASGEFFVSKRDEILLDEVFLLGGNVAACRHGNGKDWWIIISEANTNKRYKILLHLDGVFEISTQNIGDITSSGESITGSSQFTPNGEKLILYNATSDLQIFDFDRCTGALSNDLNIRIQDLTDRAGFAGLAISPNSRYAYLPSTNVIYQYDLLIPDIESSKETVAVFNGYRDQFNQTVIFYQAQLAPDGKIYVGTPNKTGIWHVIEKPNENGINCQVSQAKVKSPFVVESGGLPNFPNFRLGPKKGSSCDDLDTPSWLTIEAHPYDQLVCQGSETHFEVTAFGHPLNYQWQINEGNGWKDLQNDNLFLGANENYLSLNETESSMDGWQFRCIVQTDTEIDTSRTGALSISRMESVVADFEVKVNEDTVWLSSKSKNATYHQWQYGNGYSIDSIENPAPYRYYLENYDTTKFHVELLVQNECSHAWIRDSISVHYPKMELDIAVIEHEQCERPHYGVYQDVSKNNHRVRSRKWYTFDWGWLNDPINQYFFTDYNQDSSIVRAEYDMFASAYGLRLIACDEIQCDTFQKDTITRVYNSIGRSTRALRRSDRVYLFDCGGCARMAETITWSFENGDVFLVGDEKEYEFEKDSIYNIILKASNPCEIVYDTIAVNVTTTNTHDLTGLESKINVFPNPTSADLTIEFEEYITGAIEFRLNDLTGRPVETFDLSNSPSQQIQLSDYPPGVYFYQVLVDGVPWKTDRLLMVR